MKRFSYILVWLVAIVAIACALLGYEKDLLWKVQELNLFLNTQLFFKQQMVVPGGMLTFLGTFFTQFLYYPIVGVLMICAWWMGLMCLVKRTFQVPSRWAALMLVPVALLLLTVVDMGYWVYLLKLRGHFFVSTIGCTLAVALMWAFRALPRRFYLNTLFMAFVAVIGYPLMGIYALAAVALMAVWSWGLHSKTVAIINTVVAVLVVVAVPLLFYRYVYYQTNLTNIYFAELPLYYLDKEYHQYYIPYYLLLAYFIVMACVPWKAVKTDPAAVKVAGDSKQKQSSDKGKKKLQHNAAKQVRADKKSVAAPKWRSWASDYGWGVAIVVLLAVGVVRFWYKDTNFHRELRMQHCIDRLDWEGVVGEAAAQKEEPTRAIVMMKNLALFRLGRQSTEMYNFRNGSKASNAPFGVRMMQVVGMLIYYQYGKLNDCARLTMEMGVEYDWRAEYYKYLVRCAILDGDKPLARKYINILKKTSFFKDWASWAEKLMNNSQLIAKDKEMEPITHMLHYPDELGSDKGFVENYLMKHLAHTNNTEDPVFQEQCLLAAMWLKEPELFWYQINNYIKLHPNAQLPLYYQQAIYTFSIEGNRPNIDNMPFDPAVKDVYARFDADAAKYDGLDITQVREMLYPLYGNTYFYDYYLMSDLPQY